MERELIHSKCRGKMVLFRRNKLYTQQDIDDEKFILYELDNEIEYSENLNRNNIHKFIREYLEKYGNHSNAYIILTKYGNFKYLFNNRPYKDKHKFPEIIKFSPKRDGERDIIYIYDKRYLDQRWRVFNLYW